MTPATTTGAVSHPAPPSSPRRPAVVDVLIVDDGRAASYALWALLNWQPGLRICGTAESRERALGTVRQLTPDDRPRPEVEATAG